jgi:hypothetical protein
LPTARLVHSLAWIERQKTDIAIWLRRRKFKSSSSNLVPKRRSSIGIYYSCSIFMTVDPKFPGTGLRSL